MPLKSLASIDSLKLNPNQAFQSILHFFGRMAAQPLFVPSDVSSEAAVKTLVQSEIVTYGKLACAFNNAGIEPQTKPLHEQSIEDFDKLMSIMR